MSGAASGSFTAIFPTGQRETLLWTSKSQLAKYPEHLVRQHGHDSMSASGAGWVARVGSALFLCVQILMLLDFVVNWNDTWVDQEDNRCAARMLLSYVAKAPADKLCQHLTTVSYLQVPLLPRYARLVGCSRLRAACCCPAM